MQTTDQTTEGVAHESQRDSQQRLDGRACGTEDAETTTRWAVESRYDAEEMWGHMSVYRTKDEATRRAQHIVVHVKYPPASASPGGGGGRAQNGNRTTGARLAHLQGEQRP